LWLGLRWMFYDWLARAGWHDLRPFHTI
jgi:hypothetical protein